MAGNALSLGSHRSPVEPGHRSYLVAACPCSWELAAGHDRIHRRSAAAFDRRAEIGWECASAVLALVGHRSPGGPGRIEPVGLLINISTQSLINCPVLCIYLEATLGWVRRIAGRRFVGSAGRHSEGLELASSLRTGQSEDDPCPTEIQR